VTFDSTTSTIRVRRRAEPGDQERSLCCGNVAGVAKST
jgi:hypothetical protein